MPCLSFLRGTFLADRGFDATQNYESQVYFTGSLLGGRTVMRSSPVIKRSIAINGRKTSISLEDAFWSNLKDIAHERDETLSHVVTSINANREFANLSSALRLFVLEFYKERVAELGQREISQRRKRPRLSKQSPFHL
jgi:predicted DNA-binding ribbon-helix-helix protein